MRRPHLFVLLMFVTCEDFRLKSAPDIILDVLKDFTSDSWEVLLHLSTSPVPQFGKVDPQLVGCGLGTVGNYEISDELWQVCKGRRRSLWMGGIIFRASRWSGRGIDRCSVRMLAGKMLFGVLHCRGDMRGLFVFICGGRVRIENIFYVPDAVRVETLPAILLDSPKPYLATLDTGRLPALSLPG